MEKIQYNGNGLEIMEMAWDKKKSIEITELHWNYLKWIEVIVNGFKLMKMDWN